MLYSSNAVLHFCIFSLSRQQKLVLLKKCQMLIFFFNKINAELNAFMIHATNTITGVSLFHCNRKHYFSRKQKFGTMAIRQNECFLICTCPVSYPNMGILKMKKSLNGVPNNLI